MHVVWATLLTIGVMLGTAHARQPGEPVRLEWTEGDVAGFSAIKAPDGSATIGSIEYHQTRKGDLLEAVRVGRFNDGSSDEDSAVARIAGGRLESLSGRSIIRDAGGQVVVDVHIDVEHDRIHGFWMDGGERQEFDHEADLPPATYWGPLIFIVLKNFDVNAEGGRVRFQTVAPTPKPRVLTLELVRDGEGMLDRPGGELGVEEYMLRPNIAWAIDPIIHALVPSTRFFVEPGDPPALARFAGPRNYAGQEIRLE